MADQQSGCLATSRRLQRSRTKTPGIPEGCIYVGRPTIWGNPAKIGSEYNGRIIEDNMDAVEAFYQYCIQMATENPYGFAAWIRPLVGKDVCCWCSPDQRCHADVLLYFASRLFFKSVERGKANFSEAFFIPKQWPTLEQVFENHDI